MKLSKDFPELSEGQLKLLHRLIADEVIGQPEIAHLYGSEKQLAMTDDGDIFENDIAIGNNALRADQRIRLAQLLGVDK